MELVSGPQRPLSLNTIERETVFNLETMMASVYRQPGTTTYPQTYKESDAVYDAPVMSKRIIPCPDGKMRMIYTIAFQVDPMAGYNANGIWNHVLNIAPTLVI